MDIVKAGIVEEVEKALKEYKDLHVKQGFEDAVEINKIARASIMVRVKTERGPRYFEVRVVEKL